MTTEHDALFTEWLEAMPLRLDRFTGVTMPAQWTGDHSRESLVALEQHILDRWPDRTSFGQEQDTDFIDGATRYIGETYLRLGGGGWFVNHDPEFTFSGRPCVRLDLPDAIPLSPVNLMTALLARRTGQVLARVWDGQTENVAERRVTEAPGWAPAREPVPGITIEARPTSPELDAWTAGIPQLLESLRTHPAAGTAPLDLSPESLPALAAVVLADPQTKVAAVAYLGEAARKAAGGEWVLLVGDPDHPNPFVGRPFVERTDHPNPFVGRPFVERTDSEGDRRTTLLTVAIDMLLDSRDPAPLLPFLHVYATPA